MVIKKTVEQYAADVAERAKQLVSKAGYTADTLKQSHLAISQQVSRTWGYGVGRPGTSGNTLKYQSPSDDREDMEGIRDDMIAACRSVGINATGQLSGRDILITVNEK